MKYIKLFKNQNEAINKVIETPNTVTLETSTEVLHVPKFDNKVVLSKKDDFITYEKVPEIEFVDLGLPSGTLWMKYELGATGFTYGKYTQWGSTTLYNSGEFTFDYTTSPCNGGNSSLNSDSANQWLAQHTTNGQLNLDVDAVYANTYGQAKIPTQEQLNELLENTTQIEFNNEYQGPYIENSDYPDLEVDGFSPYIVASKTDPTKYIIVGIGSSIEPGHSGPSFSSMTWGFPAIVTNQLTENLCLYTYNNNILGDGGIDNSYDIAYAVRFRGVKV